jgi:hypothetical protein
VEVGTELAVVALEQFREADKEMVTISPTQLVEVVVQEETAQTESLVHLETQVNLEMVDREWLPQYPESIIFMEAAVVDPRTVPGQLGQTGMKQS